MSFEELASKIKQVGAVSGRNDKTALLKRYADVPGFKEILQFIFNPYIRTGIAATKLKKAQTVNVLPNYTWQSMIQYLTAHQTGSGDDVAAAKGFIYQQPSDVGKWLATAIVTKDLKIGVTETTLNNVYGDDFIPKIGIMRGEKYKDFKDKVKGPFIVTEKLDGARRILVKEAGKVTLYTRSGHIDEGLVDIEAEAQFLPDNSVFDGELLAVGEFNNSIELRQASNSIANANGERHGVVLNVFDMIALDEFKRGVSTHNALIRKVVLGAMFADESIKVIRPDEWLGDINAFNLHRTFTHIKPVPILGLVNTEAEILEIAKPIWDRGFEGVMLNMVDGLYEVHSSPRRQLLKVKATEEFTLKVTGVFEGEGRLKGMLGGVFLDYNGHQVGCGSGFNDEQRKRLWNDNSLIVGKMVEIDCFGESKNQLGGTSLNCPIFKRIVGDI